MAPPAPMASVASAGMTNGGSANGGAGPSPDEQFFAPAVLQPIDQLPPMASAPASRSQGRGPGVGNDAGKWIMLAAMLLFFVAAVVTARLTFTASSAHTRTPVVLPPRPASEGLPSGLDTVVRIQAESARRTALQTAEQIRSGDTAQLAAAQPGFRWVAGDSPSTDAHTVSVGQSHGVVTMAVAASNHDVCAFGQWSPGGTPRYVTMGHEPSCAAIDAPNAGWSSEAGGAASDLPDENG
jgi:hypothetical protein